MNWMTLPRPPSAPARAAAARIDKMSDGRRRSRCRVPFLDHRFVELALSIPTEAKVPRRRAEARAQAGGARRHPGRADRPAEAGLPRAGRRVVPARARRPARAPRWRRSPMHQACSTRARPPALLERAAARRVVPPEPRAVVEGSGRGVITFFTIPKAWRGDAARLQENAVGSWLAARRARTCFSATTRASPTPLRQTRGRSTSRRSVATTVEHRCWTVSSCRPTNSRPPASSASRTPTSWLRPISPPPAARVQGILERFLVIGESWDTDVEGQAHVRTPAGRPHSSSAASVARGTRLVPLHARNLRFDPTVCRRTRRLRQLARLARPNHRRGSRRRDTVSARSTPVAWLRPRRAMGSRARESDRRPPTTGGSIQSKDQLFTRFDATHLLHAAGPSTKFGATLRAKERARKLAWKVRHGQLPGARTPQ